MISIIICPLSDAQQITTIDEELNTQSQDSGLARVANEYARCHAELRENEVRAEGPVLHRRIRPLGEFLETLDEQLPTRNGYQQSFAVLTAFIWPAKLKPLDDCIRSIFWELLYPTDFKDILGGNTIEELTTLLRCAALCQVRIEIVSLVTPAAVSDVWECY
jgi:hypothetical protein